MLEELQHRPRHGPERDEILRLQPLGREAPDGEQRSINGKRRDDCVHTGTIREPRVYHGRAVVDPTPHATHDPVDYPEQVPVVLERGGKPLELPAALHVDELVRVHQDVADGGIPEERFQRTQAEDLVDHLGKDDLTLAHAQRRAFFRDQLEEERANLRLRPCTLRVGERLQVQPVQELSMYVGLELEVLRTRRLGPGRAERSGSNGSEGSAHVRALFYRRPRNGRRFSGSGLTTSARPTSERVKLPNCAAISEWLLRVRGTPELSASETVR